MSYAVNPITNNCFLSLPIDIVRLILNGLDVKSLIQFERTYPGYDNLTDHSWSYRRIQDFFQFDWSFLEKDAQANKWNYILSKLLIRHDMRCFNAHYLEDENQKIAAAKKIHEQWGSLFKRFPLWGCYLEEDLLEVSKLSLVQKIGKPFYIYKQKLADRAKEEKWGGDLLLHGLCEVKKITALSLADKTRFLLGSTEKIQQVFSHFAKAMEKKAVCAAYFAVHIPFDRKWKEPLFIAAAKLGDSKAIEILRSREGSQSQDYLDVKKVIQEAGCDLSAIENQWEQLDSHYTELLEVWGDQALAYMLAQAAYVKKQLNRLEAADLLYTQALKKYGKEAPREALSMAAHIKFFHLQQFEAADALYAQLLKNYKSLICTSVWTNAISTKRLLEKYEEADSLYEQVLSLHGDKAIPVELKTNMSVVKYHLKQFDVADDLCSQVLEHYGEQAAERYVWRALLVKIELKQWQEADRLSARLLKMEGDKALGSTWAKAAFIKVQLNQLKEADALYTRALEIYGDQAPASVVAEAEDVKIKLKKVSNDTSN